MTDYETAQQRGHHPADWISVPPVFIVGPPRSGTTLMRLMLSSHPQISISSEGAYVYHLRSRLADYGDLAQGPNLEKLHRDLRPFLEAERFLTLPDFEELRGWVDDFGADLRSLITFLGTWEARGMGKSHLAWWGDNAPYHIYHVPFFEALFPGSKFIVMVRDPRDACASSKRSFPWHNLDEAISRWETSLRDGLTARFTLGPARVKIVKYEDLVRSPQAQLQEICRFLEVEYRDEMLSYHQSPAAQAIAQMRHHRGLLKPVFASSIGRHREDLGADEIEAIGRRLYSAMRCLGYISYEEYEDFCSHVLGGSIPGAV